MSRFSVVSKCLSISVLSFCCTSVGYGQSFAWLTGGKTYNVLPTYSTSASYSTTNSPGSKLSSKMVADAHGDLWLWGGISQVSSSGYADLWNYKSSTGEWKMVSGPQGPAVTSNFGVLGTDSPTNQLGTRSTGGMWAGNDGNLYFFGGNGQDSTAAIGNMNDFWRYNPTSNIWTWIGGSNLKNQPTVAAAPGVFNSTNIPGARSSFSTWKDTQGNFWLFGGNGYDSASNSGHLNDLWKYDVSLGQWAFIAGTTLKDSSGIYGTKFIPNAANSPGSRLGSGSTVDPNGNFWIYGGSGYDSAGTYLNMLNDLWKFNPTTLSWAWMGGYSTYTSYANKPSYGKSEEYNFTNNPSGRQVPCLWFDKDDDLVLYGGIGINESAEENSLSILGDIWKFNTTLNQWAYIKGSLNGFGLPTYGPKGVTSTEFTPGPIAIPAITTLPDKTAYLYGGANLIGYNIPSAYGISDNLWKADTPDLDIIGNAGTFTAKVTSNPKKGDTTKIKATGTINNITNTKGIPSVVGAAYLLDAPGDPLVGAPVAVFVIKAVKDPKPGKTAKPGKLSVSITYPGNATGKYLALKLDAINAVSEKKKSNNIIIYSQIN